MDLVYCYLRRRLDSWGYSECDLRYGFGHCQGDGVAWYGELGEAEVLRMLPRLGLACSQYALIRRALSAGAFCVTICKIGPQMYDHFNTMEVDLRIDDEDALSRADNEALDALLDAIEEDVQARSKELEREGYRILDAIDIEGQHAEYRRENLLVEIRIHPPVTVDVYRDDAESFMLARRLMRGNKLYDLEVAATWHGETVRQWLCGIEDTPDRAAWRSCARELLGELAAEFRAARKRRRRGDLDPWGLPSETIIHNHGIAHRRPAPSG